MACKPRSKRQPDDEVEAAGHWEGLKSQQQAPKVHLGANGLKAVQQRTLALVSKGWRGAAV